MTSTRLTNDIRESLTRDIMRHRFTADVDDLLATQAAFAMRVYDDLFNADMRTAMSALPDGWLNDSDDIGVQFGYVGGSNVYTRLWFSGYLTGSLGQLQTKRDTKKTMRVPASKAHGCVKVYDPSHPLSKDFDRIRIRTKSLRENVDTAKRSVETALNAVTTIKRLVETWPEVAEFAKKYDTEKPQLPALPTEHLNQLLRLP
jgi:hypothetical protein